MSPADPICCSQDGRTKRARRVDGLTLLEVLAAFLIFSMVFTVLVGTSQRGVKSQGISARRLLASEIADLAMAELEAPLVARGLPSIPEEEYEEEDFTIRIAAAPVGNSDAGSSGEIGDPPAEASADGGLEALAAQVPEVAKFMRRYDIEVEWAEGAGTQSVRRTTFAFDWQGAATEYAPLFTAGGAGDFATLAATAASTTGAAGDSSGSGASSAGADGAAGDRGRGAGAGSNSELQAIIAEFCGDPTNAANAPEVCGGR